MYQNPVIIPALNPPERLIPYVKELIQRGMENILLVDDGSREEFRTIFDALELQKEVTILRHAVNLGKGRALKDAFNYVLLRWGKSACGVITADSDGQHTVDDVVRFQELLDAQTVPEVILGTRDFDEGSVPFKSCFGNKLTSVVFRLLYGVRVNDTQTGLRAIPMSFLGAYCAVSGERFEYETNLLIFAAQQRQNLRHCRIETVYFDGNSETHFRPIVDSLKIYRVIFSNFFRYMLASLSSCFIDWGLFWLFLLPLAMIEETTRIVIATVLARLLSSLYNFTVNRRAVFKSGGTPFRQAARYYLLCIFQMCLSAGFTAGLCHLFGGSELLKKALVDTVLFLFSYQIQRIWVFRERSCT